MHSTHTLDGLHTDFYKHIQSTPILETTLGNSHIQIDLKDETQQQSGSFKDRGAMNAVLALLDSNPIRLQTFGIVTASAGNHGQGVARAAKILGVQARIFVPQSTPESKLIAMGQYGAQVIKVKGDVDGALQSASKYSADSGAYFIHPFDDELVIAGQSSVGTEILNECSHSYDKVFVPVGGGGLIAGIASALHNGGSRAEVIGVQLKGSDSFSRSLEKGRVVSLAEANPLSDGTAVRSAGSLTLRHALELPNIRRVIVVSESELGDAMVVQDDVANVIAEPAGSLALAGMRSELLRTNGTNNETWLGIVSGNHRDPIRYQKLREAAILACG